MMQKALITGASSSLGASLAAALTELGFELFLTGRDSVALEALKKLLASPFIHILPADLLSKDGKDSVLTWIKTESFDLIINNAGIGLYGEALSHKTADLLAILNLNASVTLELTLEGAKELYNRKKPGTILNISSATDVLCYPTFATYSASKAFVTQFSRALHEELKNHDISILVASPGQINTKFSLHTSKGYFQKVSSQAISCKEATKEILWQLQKKKPYHVFPKKIRFLRWILLHLIPQKLAFFLLKRGIQDRYPH